MLDVEITNVDYTSNKTKYLQFQFQFSLKIFIYTLIPKHMKHSLLIRVEKVLEINKEKKDIIEDT